MDAPTPINASAGPPMINFLIAVCTFSCRTAVTELTALPTALSRPAISNIPFKTPAGWKAETKDGSTTLTPGDMATGKIYAVVITPAPGKASSLDDMYQTGTKMMAEIGTYKPLTAVQQAKSDGDWDYKFTIGTVEKDGSGFLAQIMSVKKDDDGGTVIVLSDSMETMQKYSDDFSNMIRSLGGSAKPPAPVIAAGLGTVDLHFTVPNGWVETKKPGVTVIEASKDEFYTKYRWTLVVMPSQPMSGSIRDTFKDYWDNLITANYEASIVPLPLMAKLEDGYSLAFDADSYIKNKVSGAKPRTVSVYLLIHGDRFVPMLAITYGFEKPLEDDFTRMIETARIPNSSNTKTKLFTKADVAGDWHEGSTSIASYVTAGGSYAGDASIATAEDYHFNSDGTFKHSFMGLQGATHIRETSQGSWTINENELVLVTGKEKLRYSLLGCGSDPKAGRFLVLGNGSNVKAKLSLSNPRGPFQATWFKAK